MLDLAAIVCCACLCTPVLVFVLFIYTETLREFTVQTCFLSLLCEDSELFSSDLSVDVVK